MSPTEIIAIIVALGGFITALATARAAVTQSQLSKAKQETEDKALELKAESESTALELKTKVDVAAEEQKLKNERFDREFALLRSENERLDKSVSSRSQEIERLFAAQSVLRQDVAKKEEEIIVLRIELSTEKRLNAYNSQRTTELENRVAALMIYQDVLIAAMVAANIPIPPKPGTGPLKS